MNNISGTVVLEDKDFVWLETLDLSCNHLTTEDVLALGVLPVLKVLHLTGKVKLVNINKQAHNFLSIHIMIFKGPNLSG